MWVLVVKLFLIVLWATVFAVLNNKMSKKEVVRRYVEHNSGKMNLQQGDSVLLSCFGPGGFTIEAWSEVPFHIEDVTNETTKIDAIEKNYGNDLGPQIVRGYEIETQVLGFNYFKINNKATIEVRSQGHAKFLCTHISFREKENLKTYLNGILGLGWCVTIVLMFVLFLWK